MFFASKEIVQKYKIDEAADMAYIRAYQQNCNTNGRLI
jgi:hypothetical protein